MTARLLRGLCGLALVASTALSASGQAEVGGPGAFVDAARLQLSLTTTSGWTTVSFSPGHVVADHVTAHSGRARYAASSSGVSLTRVLGTASVTTEIVLADMTDAAAFQVDVDKGALGRTQVAVTNTNGAPYPVVTAIDEVHHPGSSNNRVSVTVSRDQLMSTSALPLPRADSRQLVLAAYYPWYADYSSHYLADTPVDPRSVWDPAGVTSMTRQAAAAGIDGFVVSWHGNARDGDAMNLVQRASEATGQLFTAYLEVPSARRQGWARSPAAQVREWLAQALARSGSPAFLRAPDGVPVVFVYGMAHLTPSRWHDVLFRLVKRNRPQVHLVGDSLDPAYRPYEWGVHRYAVLDPSSELTAWSRTAALDARAAAAVDPAAAPLLYAGTVSPGFDDQRLRGGENPVIPRGSDGSRYDDTWAAALAGAPDWIFVSTWNEWYEDTEIEPGIDTGSRALTQTAQHVAAWRGPSGAGS